MVEADFGDRSAPLIPDYAMLRRIGRGSFGDVWIARNVTGALRAIKVVWRDRFVDSEPYDREFRGLQRFAKISLECARQLALLHVGRDDQSGFFYSVMELADDAVLGRAIDPTNYVPLTLRELRIRKGRLPSEDVIRVGSDLAGALMELHQHGLIHRDIKPSNVILVGGVPKLADIGLVALAGDAPTLQIGTEGFLPPEGGPGRVEGDVYATGKVLYELATGLDRTAYPSLPPGLDGWQDAGRFFELNEVIDRACRSDPLERYQSASELHGELALLNAGESVKRLRSVERWGRRTRRALALAVLLLVVSGGLYLRVHQRERSERLRLGDALRQQAIVRANEGDPLGSLPWLVRAAELHEGFPIALQNDWNQAALALRQSPRLTVLYRYPSHINDVRFTPDGLQLAVSTDDGSIDFWDPAQRTRITSFHPHSISALSRQVPQGLQMIRFSPDGGRAVAAGDQGSVFLWDRRDPTNSMRILPHPERVDCAVFSPDAGALATSCWDGGIRIWDIRGEPRVSHQRGNSRAMTLAFTPDGKHLAAGLADDTVRFFDSSLEILPQPPLDHGGWVYSAEFSPDGTLLATACGDQDVRIWNYHSGEVVRILPHQAMATTVRFSEAGDELLSVARDGEIRLWNLRRFVGTAFHLPHPENAFSADLSRDGRWIAGGGGGGVLRIWDRRPSSVARPSPHGQPHFNGQDWEWPRLDLPKSNVNSSPTPESGELLLADVGREKNGVGFTCIRHRVGVEFCVTFGGGKASRCYLSPTPCERLLAVNAACGIVIYLQDSQKVVCWDLLSHRIRFQRRLPKGLYRSAVIQTGGRWATLEASSHVELVDLSEGRMAGILAERQPGSAPYYVTTSAFSSDGRFVAAAGSAPDEALTACSVYRLSEAGPEPVAGSSTIRHRDGIRCLAFTTDSRKLATGGEDREVNVWSTETWERLVPAMRHLGQVRQLVISTDGSRLLSCSESRPGVPDTLGLWDLNNGAALTSRIGTGATVIRIGYLEAGNAWVWLGEYPGIGPVSDGRLFWSELSTGEVFGLRNAAVAQTGFQLGANGDLQVMPIESVQEAFLARERAGD